MTIFGGSGRNSGHLAGAGHAAAGMVRRSTAPGPPQMNLDSTWTSLSPPPSSSSAGSNRPADDRQYFEGPPPATASRAEERTKRSWGSSPTSRADERSSVHTASRAERRSTFNGRRSVDSMYATQGHVPALQGLEEENRYLREELSRLQSNAIDSLHRRPMAAIAGGGFRGPTSQKQHCMCDSLRSKLAKIRQELREARGEQRLPSRGGFPMEVRDNEAQTSPKLKPAEESMEQPTYQPPQTAPSSFTTPARMLASAFRNVCGSVDAPTQTVRQATAEASSQAAASNAHAEAQTVVETDDLGVQAGSGISFPADVETQTPALRQPVMTSTASQAAADALEAAVQVAPMPSDATSQTDAILAPSTAEAEVQAGVRAATVIAAAMQTDVMATAEAACEANIPLPSKQWKSCSAACQTIPPVRSVAAVQTVQPKNITAATQASAPPGIDRATQAEDDRLEVALRHVAEKDARIQELEARLKQLTGDNEALLADTRKEREKAEAFQHMAQTKAFGQMNVTILCPRAECTVSGERVEMDSWNPARLREEFEREVLPRFTKVFVEESAPGAPKGASKARSEAVDKAMQDFAETFRERLSAMLSAPNAAAAVQAAAASKGRLGSK